MGYGLRSAGRAAAGKSGERRTRLAAVLLPLVLGLALGALALLGGLTYTRNQAAFRAQALPATAVIDQIYYSAPTMNRNGNTSFNQYGMVRFEAHGQPMDARVLLGYRCMVVCSPQYRVGQDVLVYYSPQNLGYAQLGPPGRGNPDAIAGIWLLGGFAVIFLFAAVVNGVTRIRG
jgi:hypothetical protein